MEYLIAVIIILALLLGIIFTFAVVILFVCIKKKIVAQP